VDISAVDRHYREQGGNNVELHRKQDAVIEFQIGDGRPLRGAEVRIDQQSHDFLSGYLVFKRVAPVPQPAGEREQQLWDKLFLDVFNMAVFPFYWNDYEPQPGKPRWKDLVPVMGWCRANGVTIKGHPLYWAGVLPKWLDQFPAGDVDHLLAGRILTTTAGFAGEVSIWDVVNEAIHDVPFGTARNKPYTLADAADSVAKALRWAYAGNPSATFLVNEFDVVSGQWVDDVGPPRKTKSTKTHHPVDATSPRATFLRLIQEVDRRDVPKYDIGLQTHEPEFDWFRPQEFCGAIDAVAATGHRVHITELDIPSDGRAITGGWRTGIWTPEAQADYGEQMYRLAFGHPAVVSINYWGLSDRHIWRDEAGWLDRDYQPKPIYQRLKGLIKEQ
jgi:GH35 family endo-1,4-beta-xylanase